MMPPKAFDIKVYGLVQGVGFRPFVYGLASDLKLEGWALNRNECVEIRVQGEAGELARFRQDLELKAPPLSRIESICMTETPPEALEGFRILQSRSASSEVTQVAPDVAVCEECLEDMRRQPNRLNYPFINCTNCGPRFSIVQELPYDRAGTTMKVFTMCPQCQQEYENLRDRRFHAQPNACRECGPEYELIIPSETHPPDPGLLNSRDDALRRSRTPSTLRVEWTQSVRDGIPTQSVGTSKFLSHNMIKELNSPAPAPSLGKRGGEKLYSPFKKEAGGGNSIETILDQSCRLLREGKILAIKGIGGFHLACDANNEEAVATLRRHKQREGKPLAVMFGSLEKITHYAHVNAQEEALLLSEKRPILLLDLLPQIRHPAPFTNAVDLRKNSPPSPLSYEERGSTANSPDSAFFSPSLFKRGGQGVSLPKDASMLKTPVLSKDEVESLAASPQLRELAPSVTRGLETLGVMLPYTPFHHLLFERFDGDALVLTSGNVSDEPIAIGNAAACERLAGIADAFLLYNREIHNRSDDSVARVINGKARLIRRSRGWAPEPVTLSLNVEGIVASGAELKNCFCVGKGRQAILSQHIGDLKNFETYQFYQEAFKRFQHLFRVQPGLIACDLHPDYLSTRFAREQQLPLTPVQHHHAHIASCMAEHGLDETVIGLSFDGTGLGDDRKIWGGEFLICDLNSYERFSHFEYLPMPGGDVVVKEPWRMGLAYLYHTFGRDCLGLPVPLLEQIETNKARLLLTAIDKQLNCPLTSSLGRLFDAVAAIVGLTPLASFEAEGPIRLESLIEETDESYPYEYTTTISVVPLIRELVADLRRNVPVGVIAAKFHNSIVAIGVDLAGRIRAERGLNKVVLSGGVFQNRYLLEKIEERLREEHFTVFSHSTIPTNDGGICLGQIAVAAKRRALGLV